MGGGISEQLVYIDWDNRALLSYDTADISTERDNVKPAPDDSAANANPTKFGAVTRGKGLRSIERSDDSPIS